MWQLYRLSPAFAYYNVLKHFLKTLLGRAIGSTAWARVDKIVCAVLELARCNTGQISYFSFPELKPEWARNESMSVSDLKEEVSRLIDDQRTLKYLVPRYYLVKL